MASQAPPPTPPSPLPSEALRRAWRWLAVATALVLLVGWCSVVLGGALSYEHMLALTWRGLGGVIALRLLLAWLFPIPAPLDAFPAPFDHPLRYWHIIPAALDVETCERLILAAEAQPWTQERHTVATLDQPLRNLPSDAAVIDELLTSTWLPMVATRYKLHPEDLALREAFVIKYDAAQQRHLPHHRDASILTLSIALNNASDYKGGGTHFPCINRTIQLQHAGDMLVHCGKIQHGGVHVERGCRYVLVCFLDCAACDEFAHDEIDGWDSATPGDYEVMGRILR